MFLICHIISILGSDWSCEPSTYSALIGCCLRCRCWRPPCRCWSRGCTASRCSRWSSGRSGCWTRRQSVSRYYVDTAVEIVYLCRYSSRYSSRYLHITLHAVTNWYYAHKQFFPADGELGQLYIRVGTIIFSQLCAKAIQCLLSNIKSNILYDMFIGLQ